MGERINKNNKAFFILVFSIILVQLIISLTNAEIVGSVDNSLNFSPDDTEKIRNIGIGVVESLENFNLYAQANFQKDLNNQRAVIRINEETGLITIEAPPGTFYAEIPKGVNLDLVDNKLVFSGTIEPVTTASGSESWDARTGKMTRTKPVSERPSLKINGFEVDSENIFRVEFSEENGVRTVKLIQGKTDIKIGETALNGISKATLKLNNKNQLVFADFISPNGGDYSIVHNGRTYYFKARKNGRVIFNPENNRITGEKADLFIDNNRIKISSNLGFTVKFNEKGEVSEIILKDGTFEYDSYVYSKTTSAQGDLHIYIGQEIPKDESIKNAVSVNGDKIQLKGFVKFKGEVNYEAKSQDALTNFNSQFKNFDVLQGDVELSNDKHKVVIKDGKVKLSTENIADIGKNSFSFSYNDKDLGKISGEVDESDGELKLFAFNENNEKGVLIGLKKFLGTVGVSFTGEQTIENLEVSKHIKKLPEKISAKNSELEQINNEIARLISEGKEGTFEIQELRTQRATKQEELAELQNQKRESEANNLPKLFSVTNQDLNPGAGRWGTTSTSVYSDQTINFEVDSTGKVRAYFYNGKRYEINGEQTELPNTLAYGNRALIRELIDNGASLDNLLSSNYAQSSRENSYSYDSQEYRNLVEKAKQTRQQLIEARSFAEQTGNTQLVNEIDIQIANTYLSSKDFNSAREQYERILSDKNLDTKTQAEARVFLASTLMQQNPTANAKEIQDILRLAGESGKALEDAFVRFHIEQLISISSKEISLTNKETTLIYGEGFLGKIGDGANIALQPVTNTDLVLRKGYEVLKQQRQNYDAALTLRDAGYQVQRFRNAGINLREYAESTNLQQLQQIWTTNGYEDLISAEKLGEYARRAGYNLDRLKTIISEEESPYIAQQFQQRYERAFEIIESFRDQMNKNGRFFALVAGGIDETINGQGFQGDKSQAFAETRLGTEIGYTGLEKAGLLLGDSLTSPLTYYGVTSAVKTSGLMVGIGKVVGTDIAFSQSFAAIEGVSPETARAISLVMGGLMVKGGYDKISSFIRGGELKVGLLRVGGREIQVYTGSNRALKYAEQGLSGTKNLGNGLYELPDGKQVLLRAAKEEAWNPQLGNNPEYNDLTSTFAKDLKDSLRQNIEGTSKNLKIAMDATSARLKYRRINLPEDEILRIKRNKFNQEEIERINNARRILRENGFEKEARLLDNSENQQELLFSHYSGNEPVDGLVVQPLAKFRKLRRSGFSRESLEVLGSEEYKILGPKNLRQLIIKRVGEKNEKVLENIETDVQNIIQGLNSGNYPANTHLVSNPNSRVTYVATDARALKSGGGKQGRGNWRYLFKRNFNTNEYELIGIAKHSNSGGYDWFFLDN